MDRHRDRFLEASGFTSSSTPTSGSSSPPIAIRMYGLSIAKGLDVMTPVGASPRSSASASGRALRKAELTHGAADSGPIGYGVWRQ